MARILLFSLLLLGLTGPAQAKSLLVLFKSSEGVTAANNEVRSNLEAPLKKLGYSLVYHDADRSLPDDASMALYDGVLTWHRTARYRDPAGYVRWLRNQVTAGRKVVIFGNLGAHTTDLKTWLPNETLNEFYRVFGLDFGAAYADKGLQLVADSQLARAPQPLSYYLLYKSVNPANEKLVVVRRQDQADSDSTMVAITPAGGMVSESYIFQGSGAKLRWLVDREKFLARALQKSQAAATGGHLLALYKGTEKVDAESNFIRRFLAEPLKSLGYTVDYRDVTQGLPSPAEMGRYKGVVTWFQTASMENAAAYCQWLLQQIQAGRKVVILGNLGAYQEVDKASQTPTERWLLTHEYNSFLYPFGLEFKGGWTKDTNVLKVANRDPAMVPWLEQSHLAHYFWIESVNKENKVYLSVRRSDLTPSDSAFVVRTPFGGYILESYLFRDATGKGDYKWHVDITSFLRDALTYQAQSKPATSTVTVNPSTPANVPAASTLPPRPSLPAGTTELKRRVLAFYQRDLLETSEKNKIHDVCETFLNHLGLVVDYRAIEDGLPSAGEMEPYRGVITWFQGASIPGAPAYAVWLKSQLEGGKLAVIMGDYGAYQDKSFSAQVNPAPTLAALGVDWRAATPTSDLKITRTGVTATGAGSASIEFADPQMMKGEIPLNLDDADLRKGWPTYVSTDPKNKVYLRVKDRDGQVSDAVVVTPRGGLVAGEFLVYTPPARPIKTESTDPNSAGLSAPAVADAVEVSKLRMDAFRFFTEAFQVQDFPRCDVTTLNGSRIFFEHIDGDAMHGMSFIDRASLNAEMMLREILARYQFPVTVSFVTSNLEFKATPTYRRELWAARKILELPWVELASHTVNHPFNWRLGDLRRRSGEDSVRLERIPPDDKLEIVSSIDFVNQQVAPPGKKCKVLLWTGMCNPTEAELALTDGMGVANLNGGDPVYDSVNPWLLGVTPLYAVVGGRYQFHTCAAGDFYYTGAWTRDYDGMKKLVEYFKYTEEPRRLRAMNLYYHFYLAERALGIEGLRIALDYVTQQKPAPLYASQYVEVVKDMIVTRLGQDASGRLVIANAGAMRTIRFDNPSRLPDLDKSPGVLGYLKVGDRLYVHLDDGAVHTLAWGSQAPTKPYLERASHYVDKWQGGSRFQLRGTGPASFTLAGMVPNAAYRITVGGESKTVTSDATGRLSWQGTFAQYDGRYAVEVRKT